MEDVYYNLSQTGSSLEEAAARGGRGLLGSSQERYSSSELGSPEYIEHVRNTHRVVASMSFKKKHDLKKSGPSSGSGAKFESLGTTSYGLSGSSKSDAQRKTITSSQSTSGGRESGRRNASSESIAELSKREKGSQTRKPCNGNAGAKLRRISSALLPTGDESSDELNLTSSSQPAEISPKRHARSSDGASAPPESGSDDHDWQTSYKVQHGTRSTHQSSTGLKNSLQNSKARRINDENSFSDGTPERKKIRIKPRPAYGREKGKERILPDVDNTSSSNVTSNGPIRSLLEEKRRNDETPRPRKILKGMHKPAPFPMAIKHASSSARVSSKDSRKSCLTPFPLSKNHSPAEIVAQNGPNTRHREAQTAVSDGNESDDDPLLMNRNDEIINRGGLAPFPMSSQDRPESIYKSSEDGRWEGPVTKRRRSSGISDIQDINEYSFTQPADRPDPHTLCPYCDMPFPSDPSPLLLTMLERIPKYPDPRPANPLGLTAPLLSYVSMCQRHQFESKLLPTAVSAGWPTRIDFAALPARVSALRKRLANVLLDKEQSAFWRELKKDIGEKGVRKAMGVTEQFKSFEKSQPGYYGEQGSVIIFQTLSNLFPPETVDADRISPLTPTEFLRVVLMPECAVALIQEDLGHGTRIEQAVRTLRDSSKYGTAMFPDLDSCDGITAPGSRRGAQRVGEAIVKERIRARRKEIDEEERMEEELEQLGKKVKKTSRSKGSRKPIQSDPSDGATRSSRGQDTRRKTAKSRATTQDLSRGGGVIELSDSSALQSDASIASRTRNKINKRTTAGSDRPSPTIRKSKVGPRTVDLQPKSGRGSKSVASDLFADTEFDGYDLNEVTPRPRVRVRTASSESDCDIVLPEVDNRYAKSTQSKATKTNSRLKISGAIQPLQAVKARKTNKAAVFTHTMWENDASDSDENGDTPDYSHVKATGKRRNEPLARKNSNSWLLSDPSTPSCTP